MFRISSFYTASVTSLFEGGGYDRPAFQEPHFGGRVPLGCMAGVPCLYSNSQGAVLCGHLLNGSRSEISSHLEHRTVVTRCKSIDSTSLALAEHRPFGMFPSETGKACGIFGTSSEGAEDARAVLFLQSSAHVVPECFPHHHDGIFKSPGKTGCTR